MIPSHTSLCMFYSIIQFFYKFLRLLFNERFFSVLIIPRTVYKTHNSSKEQLVLKQIIKCIFILIIRTTTILALDNILYVIIIYICDQLSILVERIHIINPSSLNLIRNNIVAKIIKQHQQIIRLIINYKNTRKKDYRFLVINYWK